MKYIPLILLFTVICSCSKPSSNGVDSTYQRQIDDFDRQTAEADQQFKQSQALQDESERQLKRSHAQQDESERRLKRSIEQADRLDALLERWEQQAERQDRIFDGLDRIISRGADGADAVPDDPK